MPRSVDTVVVVDANGNVTYQFAGNIQAQGVDFKGGTAGANQLRWLRNSDGSVIAQLMANDPDDGAGNDLAELDVWMTEPNGLHYQANYPVIVQRTERGTFPGGAAITRFDSFQRPEGLQLLSRAAGVSKTLDVWDGSTAPAKSGGSSFAYNDLSNVAGAAGYQYNAPIFTDDFSSLNLNRYIVPQQFGNDALTGANGDIRLSAAGSLGTDYELIKASPYNLLGRALTVQWKVTINSTPGAAGSCGLIFNFWDYNNYMFVQFEAGPRNLTAYRKIAGAFTNLGTVSGIEAAFGAPFPKTRWFRATIWMNYLNAAWYSTDPTTAAIPGAPINAINQLQVNESGAVPFFFTQGADRPWGIRFNNNCTAKADWTIDDVKVWVR